MILQSRLSWESLIEDFNQLPLTLGTIPAVATEVHQKEKKKGKKRNEVSSPQHVTNLQINFYFNEPCCYLGSVLIYIGNDILWSKKKDLSYCNTIHF